MSVNQQRSIRPVPCHLGLDTVACSCEASLTKSSWTQPRRRTLVFVNLWKKLFRSLLYHTDDIPYSYPYIALINVVTDMHYTQLHKSSSLDKSSAVLWSDYPATLFLWKQEAFRKTLAAIRKAHMAARFEPLNLNQLHQARTRGYIWIPHVTLRILWDQNVVLDVAGCSLTTFRLT